MVIALKVVRAADVVISVIVVTVPQCVYYCGNITDMCIYVYVGGSEKKKLENQKKQQAKMTEVNWMW